MTEIMQPLPLRDVREHLERWAETRDEIDRRRDGLIRLALMSGMQKTEVARITGLARTTVDRIAAADVD